MFQHAKRRALQRPRSPWCDAHAPNVYFITINTINFHRLFGIVENRTMAVNAAGTMLIRTFLALEERFPHFYCDRYVVMPDHMHFILFKAGEKRVDNFFEIKNLQREYSSLQKNSGHNPTLTDVMRWYKGQTTHAYIKGVTHHGWPRFHGKLWQRSFYDTVIKSQAHLQNVRVYIENNPSKYKR